MMYRLTLDPNTVQRLADGACIPAEGDNRDSLEYQAWRKAGNTPEAAETLAEQKARYKAVISAAAEGARQQFISPGSGKAMAYQEKAAEARAFLADPQAGTPGHAAEMYPLIYAEVSEEEVERTAPTAPEVATIIAGRFVAFKAIEAQIARTESAAQMRVKSAPDLATILATVDSLEWPEA